LWVNTCGRQSVIGQNQLSGQSRKNQAAAQYFVNEPVIERSMQGANALGTFPTPATQWTFLDVLGHPWMVGRVATTFTAQAIDLYSKPLKATNGCPVRTPTKQWLSPDTTGTEKTTIGVALGQRS
jgi:hypothetical protein